MSNDIHEELRQHGAKNINTRIEGDRWHIVIILTKEAVERLGVDGPCLSMFSDDGTDSIPELLAGMLEYLDGTKPVPSRWCQSHRLAELEEKLAYQRQRNEVLTKRNAELRDNLVKNILEHPLLNLREEAAAHASCILERGFKRIYMELLADGDVYHEGLPRVAEALRLYSGDAYREVAEWWRRCDEQNSAVGKCECACDGVRCSWCRDREHRTSQAVLRDVRDEHREEAA